MLREERHESTEEGRWEVSVQNGQPWGSLCVEWPVLRESLCGMVWPWGCLCVEWSGLGEVSVWNGPAPRKSGDATPFSSLTISKQSICI